MKKANPIIFSFAIVIIFIVAAIFLLFLVSGYRFNWQVKKIIKTGTISLDGSPAGAEIYFDNQLQDKKLPARFDYLSPGNYNVRIIFVGYQDWSKDIKVEEEKVSAFEDILLFKDPTKIEFILADKSDRPDKLAKDVSVKDGSELWRDEKLLTRYSQTIKQVFWFRDDNHLILQLDNDLVAFEIDSLTTKKVYTLTSGEEFKGVDKQSIYVPRGQELYKAKII